MNRAEKYLKNGVATEELIGEMETSLCVPYCEVASFWNKQIKPTLTEDERVILRNIKNDNYGKYIGRGDSSKVNTPALWTLYLRGDDESKAYSIGTMFDHLFQFIKERRRIFY